MRTRARTRSPALAGILLALAALPAAAQDRPVQVETCLGCHGIPGYTNAYPTFPVPKLGGQKADYLVAALKAYASGERPHGTMHAQAATLSDEDMRAIAEWFAGFGPEDVGPSSQVR